MGTGGRGHLDVERGDPAGAAHGLLGSCTEGRRRAGAGGSLPRWIVQT